MSLDLLSDVLQARDIVVIERLPNFSYHVVSPQPAWLVAVFDHAAPGTKGTLAGALPFLEHFLPQAEATWQRGAQELADSGPFAIDLSGEELLLRASACTLRQRTLLIIERLTGAADTRPMLRKAREQMLDTEKLTRQVTTVHAPAAAIDRGLAQLETMSLTPDQQQVVESLRHASDQLRAALVGLPMPPTSKRRGGR